MAWETHESFEIAALIISGIGKAVTPDSDGGAKIKLSEIVSILTEAGVKIAEDVVDTDYPEEAPE